MHGWWYRHGAEWFQPPLAFLAKHTPHVRACMLTQQHASASSPVQAGADGASGHATGEEPNGETARREARLLKSVSGQGRGACVFSYRGVKE